VETAPHRGPRVVVMGVSGCGKSTVGWMLARLLDVPFVDADGLHPPANVARMAAGTPLTDDDRWPWLRAVGAELARSERGAVVACSALRRAYRDTLRETAAGTVFVHLHGTRALLASRMTARLDHFMPPSLLDTQLATLEPLQADEAGVVLDIAAPADSMAADAAAWVRGRRTAAADDRGVVARPAH
jgi:carbohydrate kinase (thermoresistant glucokinase family)